MLPLSKSDYCGEILYHSGVVYVPIDVGTQADASTSVRNFRVVSRVRNNYTFERNGYEFKFKATSDYYRASVTIAFTLDRANTFDYIIAGTGRASVKENGQPIGQILEAGEHEVVLDVEDASPSGSETTVTFDFRDFSGGTNIEFLGGEIVEQHIEEGYAKLLIAGSGYITVGDKRTPYLEFIDGCDTVVKWRNCVVGWQEIGLSSTKLRPSSYTFANEEYVENGRLKVSSVQIDMIKEMTISYCCLIDWLVEQLSGVAIYVNGGEYVLDSISVDNENGQSTLSLKTALDKDCCLSCGGSADTSTLRLVGLLGCNGERICYPMHVINVDGDELEVVQNDTEYADVWNADIANSTVGHIEPTNVAGVFKYEGNPIDFVKGVPEDWNLCVDGSRLLVNEQGLGL